MSHLLWQYFFENDLDRFRHVLARADGRPSSSRLSASPGALLSTSPTVTRHKKPQEKSKNIEHKGNVQLSRADINWKDGHGLTLLHHISSSVETFGFAQALLQHPLLDLYIQDDDNGWTALHRALYFGNVAIARLILSRDVQDASEYTGGASAHPVGGLIKIKDKDGLSPFDLYHATIEDRSDYQPNAITSNSGSDISNDGEENETYDTDQEDAAFKRRPRMDIGGDEIFMFGSNRNLTLGLGDEDDRQYPERLQLRRPDDILYRQHEKASPPSSKAKLDAFGVFEIPTVSRYKPVMIQDLQMAKLSTAIITSDERSNLYMCGFGPGGRLGTGEETTRFCFTNIRGGGLDIRHVHAIALGQNHTIAITSQGETFVWGSNAYGQLGFAPNAPQHKEEESMQPFPRRLFGQLKREHVVGAAVSRIHSAVYTASTLYTFGKNEGQMGLIDSNARSLPTQSTPRRVGASFSNSPIKSVTATDQATICLLEDYEVVVFANYGYTRNVLSPASLLNTYNSDLSRRADKFAQARSAFRMDRVTKICSGGDTICGLTVMGDVYTLQVTQQVETATTSSSSTTNPTKIREGLSQPQLIWSSKRASMAVVDVDVSENGSVIICTKSGSVWRRVKRAKIKDATARPFYKSKDYKFQRVPKLTNIVAVRSNTFGAFAAVRRDATLDFEQKGDDLRSVISNLYPFRKFGDEEAEDSDTEQPIPRFWSSRQLEGVHTIRQNAYSGRLEEEMARYLQDFSDDTYDLKVGSTISNIRIPIHSFMLAGRSPVIDKGLSIFRKEYFFSVPNIVNIEYSSEGTPAVIFQNIDFLTLLNVVLFLYTNAILEDIFQEERLRRMRAELKKIGKKLEMRGLEQTPRPLIIPAPKSEKFLHQGFRKAIHSSTFFLNGDVEIQLEDVTQLVHSALVCARCPFFEGLFQGRAGGGWLASRKEMTDAEHDQPTKVDLSHVDSNVFSFVLGHMYASPGEEPFLKVVAADLDAFLDLVIDVLSVANELMIDGLAETCQSILSRYVNIRNVCQLLNAVAPCSVTGFKKAALGYMCVNLEAMLENQLLEELEEDLLLELDETVRSAQVSGQESYRGWDGYFSARYPEYEHRHKQHQRATVDQAYLASKMREKESRTSTTRKSHVDLLEEYDHPSGTRKSPKFSGRRGSEAKSPAFGPRSASHDLMFDMDGDEAQQTHVNTAERRSKSTGQSLAPLELPEAVEIDQDQDLMTSSTSPSSHTDPSVFGQTTSGTLQIQSRAAVWANTPIATSRLDMKQIMAQASTSQPSNISLAMKGSARQPTPTKLSQKERKKLLQQQQLQASSPIPDPPSPSPHVHEKPPPWQRSVSGPQTSVKDILAGIDVKPTSPSPKPSTPTAPSMTLRQTVSGKPSTQRSVSTPSHPPPSSAPRNISTLSPSQPTKGPTLSPPRSLSSYTPTVPNIRSIRHTAPPPTTEQPSSLWSMDDILAQQQNEKDVIRDAGAKRSLMEIQEEQAFQDWWDRESRKVQEEEEARRGVGRTRAGRRGRARVRGPRGGAGPGNKRVGAGDSEGGGGESRGGKSGSMGRKGGSGGGERGGRSGRKGKEAKEGNG